MWIPHRDQTASDTDCLFHFSAVKEVERKSAVMLPVKALVPPPRCYVDIDADQSFQLCFYSGGGRPCLKQRLWEMEPRYCFTQEIFIFQWAYCFTCTFSMHGAPQIIFCSAPLCCGEVWEFIYQCIPMVIQLISLILHRVPYWLLNSFFLCRKSSRPFRPFRCLTAVYFRTGYPESQL